MLKVTGGFVPLNRIRFVHDDGTVETVDGETYQTEAAYIEAIMPKNSGRRFRSCLWRGRSYD